MYKGRKTYNLASDPGEMIQASSQQRRHVHDIDSVSTQMTLSQDQLTQSLDKTQIGKINPEDVNMQ